MLIDRSGIEARVPQAGAMCLLDSVTAWDATHIACEAAAASTAHPLSRDGGVPAVAAIEYAAQATAVHGALLEPDGGTRDGMLAKVSDVELAPGTLNGPLAIRADLLSRVASGCMYAFTVHDAGGCRARGRLLVALQDGR